MGAEGRPTLVLFSEEASHETLILHRLTTTPKGPMVAEGRPTLAPVFEEASLETIIRRPPPACENDSNNTNNIKIIYIKKVGGSLRGGTRTHA